MASKTYHVYIGFTLVGVVFVLGLVGSHNTGVQDVLSPRIGAGMVEKCANGQDDDLDGLIDSDDPDCFGQGEPIAGMPTDPNSCMQNCGDVRDRCEDSCGVGDDESATMCDSECNSHYVKCTAECDIDSPTSTPTTDIADLDDPMGDPEDMVAGVSTPTSDFPDPDVLDQTGIGDVAGGDVLPSVAGVQPDPSVPTQVISDGTGSDSEEDITAVLSTLTKEFVEDDTALTSALNSLKAQLLEEGVDVSAPSPQGDGSTDLHNAVQQRTDEQPLSAAAEQLLSDIEAIEREIERARAGEQVVVVEDPAEHREVEASEKEADVQDEQGEDNVEEIDAPVQQEALVVDQEDQDPVVSTHSAARSVVNSAVEKVPAPVRTAVSGVANVVTSAVRGIVGGILGLFGGWFK